MTSKHPKKKKILPTEIPITTIKENLISTINVKTLGTTNLIEVIFIVGKDSDSNNQLVNLKNISKNLGEVSFASVVTYGEALALIEQFVPTAGMPENIENNITNILNDLQTIQSSDKPFTTQNIAELIKIKLIQILYKDMAEEREKKFKMRAFDEELNMLTKNTKPSNMKIKTDSSRPDLSELGTVKQAAKSYSADEYRKSKSKPDEFSESIEDILFDDDISKHIWFYIFQGINDADVIKYLIEILNVPITAIVETKVGLSLQIADDFDEIAKFWDTLLGYFYGPYRHECFENTILMKYESRGNLDFEEIYSELVHMLRSIFEIKLTHLHYIRHTKEIQVKENYPLFTTECLNLYKTLLKHIPKEIINETIILSCLLQELAIHTADSFNVSSKFSLSDSNSSNTIIPLNNTNKNNTLLWNKSGYSVYSGNKMEMLLKVYNRKVRHFFSELSFDVWKKIYPFNLINMLSSSNDISHYHDGNPKSEKYPMDSDETLHFMYIFLFYLFKKPTDKPQGNLNELEQNLNVYDKLDLWQKSQVDVVSAKQPYAGNNLYNYPLISYIWHEKLSCDVLIQAILEALENYQYGQIKFCPETSKYMLLCSNYLDEFGVNVKVIDEYLPTTICLRDFCKFIKSKECEWLSKNLPPKYYRKEEIAWCYDERKLITVTEPYRMLLSSKQETEESSKGTITTKERKSMTFEELLGELRQYVDNKNLNKESGKISNSLNVFDVSTNYTSIIGAITTFISHDGVKLIIDNTRFTDEQPKCTARLSCRNIDVILHSHSYFQNHNYYFQIQLDPGTIITFYIKEFPKSKAVRTNQQEKIKQFETSKIDEQKQLKQLLKYLKHSKVLPVNHSILEEKVNTLNTNDVPDLNIETFINTISDVDTNKYYRGEQTNLKLVSGIKLNNELPLINVLDRLIIGDKYNKNGPRQQSYAKRYVPLVSHFGKHSEELDFRISLSNGLYVSCYPPEENNDPVVQIKQEFLKSYESDQVFEEEFRLFSRNGQVLIKKIDGTIEIIKASGDQFVFEKPDSCDDEVRNSNLQRCKSKSIDDYKKKLAQLMKKKYDDEDEFCSSRRGKVHTKKGYIIGEALLNVVANFKSPFKKTSVLKFSGHKTCLEGNKITQKHLHFLTKECDHSAEEIYYERSDGCRSLLDKSGKQSIEFPDGTVIILAMNVKNELVDGFVFVCLSIRYEHPKYITVGYDFDNSVFVELHNDVIITKTHQNDYNLHIHADIKLNIDTKKVLFQKTCMNCNKNYNCHFNIEPLISKKWKPNQQFIDVNDSYEKKFFVNFAGYCKRNNDFLNKEKNLSGCNHVKNNIYTKLFVFDENFIGEQFWNDEMVNLEMINGDKKIVYDDKSCINIHQDYFEKFTDCFRNKSLRQNLMFSKDRVDRKPIVEYKAFRVLHKRINNQKINTNLKQLLNYFESNLATEFHLQQIVDKMLTESKMMAQRGRLLKKEERKETPKCSCIVTHRRSMGDKIKIWRSEFLKSRKLLRMNTIPSYFESQFCNKINK